MTGSYTESNDTMSMSKNIYRRRRMSRVRIGGAVQCSHITHFNLCYHPHQRSFW